MYALYLLFSVSIQFTCLQTLQGFSRAFSAWQNFWCLSIGNLWNLNSLVTARVLNIVTFKKRLPLLLTQYYISSSSNSTHQRVIFFIKTMSYSHFILLFLFLIAVFLRHFLKILDNFENYVIWKYVLNHLYENYLIFGNYWIFLHKPLHLYKSQ